MVILAHSSYFSNFVKNSDLVPDYAKDYKNEYLFLRGINEKLANFVHKYLSDTEELFISSFSDRIKFFIKKFMQAQELGYLNDISSFIIPKFAVKNIVFLHVRMKSDFEDGEEEDVDILGYQDFYEFFCKFYNKLNIDLSKIESDSDSDSDIYIYSGSDSD